jgi:predicted N-acetyltransferase YhbS
MVSAPVVLDDSHCLDHFRCDVPELTRWLQNRARKNQREGASRCFVVCDDSDVVGYYALAAGSVSLAGAPGSIRRNMPDPIPAVVLGRLAVHSDWAGQGIGKGLLRDALLRSARAAQELGIRVFLCHAVNENAKAFYAYHGFVESPIDALTMMIRLSNLR